MLLSTKEISKLWGISARRVAILCVEGRIRGAQRVGANWGIPEYAEKPRDARVKSGKYIKQQPGDIMNKFTAPENRVIKSGDSGEVADQKKFIEPGRADPVIGK